MDDTLRVALMLAYSYLVGSIPSAYLTSRLVRGIDIRAYGSGNVGASNVARHVGKGYFVIVATFDTLAKGAASVALARVLGLDLEYQGIAAFLATIGHNWSIYIKFSGGRGISVITGSLLVLAWKLLLPSLVVAIGGRLLFRSSALSVGIAVLLLPFWAFALGEPPAILLFCLAIVVVIILKRLLSNPGTAPPGLRWRDMIISRLLYDRDTPLSGDWVKRTPDNA